MSAAVGPILYRTSISRESRLRHPEGKRVLLNIAPSPAPKLALNAGNPARARGAIESSVGRGSENKVALRWEVRAGKPRHSAFHFYVVVLSINSSASRGACISSSKTGFAELRLYHSTLVRFYVCRSK